MKPPFWATERSRASGETRFATMAFETSANLEETSGASEKRIHTTRNDVPDRPAAQTLFFFVKAADL
jgi:hypothetical protein